MGQRPLRTGRLSGLALPLSLRTAQRAAGFIPAVSGWNHWSTSRTDGGGLKRPVLFCNSAVRSVRCFGERRFCDSTHVDWRPGYRRDKPRGSRSRAIRRRCSGNGHPLEIASRSAGSIRLVSNLRGRRCTPDPESRTSIFACSREPLFSEITLPYLPATPLVG